MSSACARSDTILILRMRMMTEDDNNKLGRFPQNSLNCCSSNGATTLGSLREVSNEAVYCIPQKNDAQTQM